jgi:phosphate transport system substrate-binding protein
MRRPFRGEWKCFAAWLCMAATLTGGCSRSSIKIDGSSTVFPISQAVAEKFRETHSQSRVVVGRSGTGGGFKKFSHGEIDICDASRPITDVEKKACADGHVEYIDLEIAYDGLAVVINPKNTWCECLTVEQLKKIWEPGSKVSKWSDIDPKWPAEPIKLYGPGTDSGTFDYFTEVIVGKAKSSRDDYMQSEDDNSLVTGVAGDTHALGYFGMAYYEENQDKLKLLGVDSGDGNCVKPSQQTVRDRTYKPLSRPLFLYVRKSSLATPDVQKFVKFYLDEVGSVVTDVGYVPMPDDEAAKSKQTFDEALGAAKPAA